MDWNNDGNIDWQDFALFDSEISSGDGDGETGCLSWVVAIVFIWVLIDIIVNIFS